MLVNLYGAHQLAGVGIALSGSLAGLFGSGEAPATGAGRGRPGEAGYGRVDVLPVENDFFRLYRLEP